jgi:hypothetical protein
MFRLDRPLIGQVARGALKRESSTLSAIASRRTDAFAACVRNAQSWRNLQPKSAFSPFSPVHTAILNAWFGSRAVGRRQRASVSDGRRAPLQGSIREGPESEPKPPFLCERVIGFTALLRRSIFARRIDRARPLQTLPLTESPRRRPWPARAQVRRVVSSSMS